MDLTAPGPTRVMGVVNVTPDSFSDGGSWLDPEAAIAHGRALAAAGADILDIGGESTRPGARRVPVDEEIARVVVVIETLAREGYVVSVDTVNAATARAAVAAGARIVNDVSGGLADPAMARAVAQTGALYVAQHWRGTPETMDQLAVYDDVVGEVLAELDERVAALLAAGVDRAQIVLDPGLGFAKNAAQNWELLRRVDELMAHGYPLLVGASRKRFLAGTMAPVRGSAPRERDVATAAVTALVAQRRVWGVRVHDAAGSFEARAVAEAMRRG